MIVNPGFPRANSANVTGSSPLMVAGLQAGVTQVLPIVGANIAHGAVGDLSNALAGAGLLVFDEPSARWVRWQSARSMGDGTAAAQAAAVHGVLYNGSTFDQSRNNSAANLSATVQPFAQQTAAPGEWTVISAPATNAQASNFKAAGGAGVRHVVRSLHFSIAGSAASNIVGIYIWDGSSGSTMLWAGIIACPANDSRSVSMSGLNLIGSPNTGLTIEFSAAGGANTVETCSMSGYSTI